MLIPSNHKNKHEDIRQIKKYQETKKVQYDIFCISEKLNIMAFADSGTNKKKQLKRIENG